jgi:hypothetical protein
MTRKEVSDCITWNMFGYGQGCSYDVNVNGQWARSMQHVRDTAEKGDKVEVSVYRGWNALGTERFEIKPLDEAQRNELERRRERKRKRRDHQRQRCYNFETAHCTTNSERITDPEEAQAFVDRVWDFLGRSEDTCPEVDYDTRLENNSHYKYWDNQVRFCDGGKHEKTILHEVAHAVNYHDGVIEGNNWHGGVFVQTICLLYGEFLGLNYHRLVEKARDRGLDVDQDYSPFEGDESGGDIVRIPGALLKYLHEQEQKRGQLPEDAYEEGDAFYNDHGTGDTIKVHEAHMEHPDPESYSYSIGPGPHESGPWYSATLRKDDGREYEVVRHHSTLDRHWSPLVKNGEPVMIGA